MALSPNIVSGIKGGGLITAFPTRAFAITPSDETTWTEAAVTVYCNGAGTVVVEPFDGGGTVSFEVTAGATLPVSVRRVLSTGTTAAISLVGVY